MSNACFGNTMENLRKQSKIKIVSDPHQAATFAQRQPSSPLKLSIRIWFPCYSKTVVWTKPSPAGASIFHLSKLSYYKFHYKEMVPRYLSAQLKVGYKYTDSILYQMETSNLYKDMASSKHLLDLSDHPKDHYLYDPSNKKVPLTMNDELQGKVLRQVVCNRSKLYSIDYAGGKKHSANGVQKSVKKTLNHNLLRQFLFSEEKVSKTMTELRSHCHQIVVNEIDKLA